MPTAYSIIFKLHTCEASLKDKFFFHIKHAHTLILSIKDNDEL